jgi:peroxiredoxin family protein
MPTMLAGLPGMENVAAKMMKRRMDELGLPSAREMLETLHDAGAQLYACQLAMEMMDVKADELMPQVEAVITAGDFYELADGAQIIFT